MAKHSASLANTTDDWRSKQSNAQRGEKGVLNVGRNVPCPYATQAKCLACLRHVRLKNLTQAEFPQPSHNTCSCR